MICGTNRTIGQEQGKEREIGARQMPKERQHSILYNDYFFLKNQMKRKKNIPFWWDGVQVGWGRGWCLLCFGGIVGTGIMFVVSVKFQKKLKISNKKKKKYQTIIDSYLDLFFE